MFTPLQGDQLLHIILDDLKKKLKPHPAFSPSTGHINVKYAVTVHVESSPYDAGRVHDIVVDGKAAETSATGEVPKEVAEALQLPTDEAGKPMVQAGDIKLEKSILRPNQARAEAGLPVEEKQETTDGQISDVGVGQSPFAP